MALTTFEASCDIAVVRAVLPTGVAVSREGLVAVGARKAVDRFLFHLLRVSIPPLLAAGSGTELYPFPARRLKQWYTAEKTEVLLRRDAGIARSLDTRKLVSAAVGFYIIFRETDRFGDCRIAAAAQPHCGYALSLFVGHALFLQSEEPCPHYPLEKKKPIVQKESKKIMPTREKSPMGINCRSTT